MKTDLLFLTFSALVANPEKLLYYRYTVLLKEINAVAKINPPSTHENQSEIKGAKILLFFST